MPDSTSVAVILAGGSGQRLWPLSDEGHPKQFLRLAPGGSSLIQATLERLRSITEYDSWCVTTASHLVDRVKAHLPDLPSANLIVEPVGRGTGPAIVWAAMEIARRYGPNTVLSIHPADHWIENFEVFSHLLSAAIELARQEESVVLLGVPPCHAATEYGYIERGEAVRTVQGVQAYSIKRFFEKPDSKTAGESLVSGQFSWNSGILISKVDVLLEEIRKYAPECLRQFEEKAEAAFFDLPESSIERTVLEKTRRSYVLSADFGWHDLGDWDTVERLLGREDMNLKLAKHVRIDAEGTILYSHDNQELIVTVGIENTLIVRLENLTLVVKRDKIGMLKKILPDLRQNLK